MDPTNAKTLHSAPSANTGTAVWNPAYPQWTWQQQQQAMQNIPQMAKEFSSRTMTAPPLPNSTQNPPPTPIQLMTWPNPPQREVASQLAFPLLPPQIQLGPTHNQLFVQPRQPQSDQQSIPRLLWPPLPMLDPMTQRAEGAVVLDASSAHFHHQDSSFNLHPQSHFLPGFRTPASGVPAPGLPAPSLPAQPPCPEWHPLGYDQRSILFPPFLGQPWPSMPPNTQLQLPSTCASQRTDSGLGSFEAIESTHTTASRSVATSVTSSPIQLRLRTQHSQESTSAARQSSSSGDEEQAGPGSDTSRNTYRQQTAADVIVCCDHCNERFICSHNPDRIKYHKTIANLPAIQACDVCGGGLSAAYRPSSNPDDKHIFECHTCGVKFSRSDRLLAHSCIHSRKKPFVCSVLSCHVAFSRKHRLSKHSKCAHGRMQQAQYPCSDCDTVFDHASKLFKHMKTKHPREGIKLANFARKRKHADSEMSSEFGQTGDDDYDDDDDDDEPRYQAVRTQLPDRSNHFRRSSSSPRVDIHTAVTQSKLQVPTDVDTSSPPPSSPACE